MIDDAFGHWFAGFVDGEGSFTIHRRAGRDRRTGGQCSCRLSIGLRADDLPILREIRDRLGAGFVTGEQVVRKTSNPQHVWIVNSKAGCALIVSVLDRYPLRAKKARDYAIWREAVLEWQRVTQKGGRRSALHDWGRMEELKRALEAGRRFDAEPIAPRVAESAQLEFS